MGTGFPSRQTRNAFARRSCSNKKTDWDDNSKKRHPNLGEVNRTGAPARLRTPMAPKGVRLRSSALRHQRSRQAGRTPAPLRSLQAPAPFRGMTGAHARTRSAIPSRSIGSCKTDSAGRTLRRRLSSVHCAVPLLRAWRSGLRACLPNRRCSVRSRPPAPTCHRLVPRVRPSNADFEGSIPFAPIHDQIH